MGAYSDYLYVAGIDGDITGASVSWNPSWSGDLLSPVIPGPNVLEAGSKCIVTTNAVAGMGSVPPNPGTLTLTPSISCSGSDPIELDPITLTVGLTFISPAPTCCCLECSCDISTCWSEGTLVWSESTGGWYYDGYYGGCDECPRYISASIDSADWVTGFRPTSVTLDVTIHDGWRMDNEYTSAIVFYIATSGGEYSYSYSSTPDELKPAGQHQLTFDLTDVSKWSWGSQGDILELGLWLGYGDGSTSGNGERSFTVTNIAFTPKPTYRCSCEIYWEDTGTSEYVDESHILIVR